MAEKVITMECSNCGQATHGGYCECMIIDGEFKGAWWLEETDNEELKGE